MTSKPAFRITCTRSTTLQGFYKHGHLGTLHSCLASLAKLPDFAGHRESDCYECLCNSGKAPELDPQAVVTALKSADGFLQTLHTQLFSLIGSDVK